MQFLESVATSTNKNFELGLPIQGEKAFLRGVPASHPLFADALLYGQQKWSAEHDDAPQFLQRVSRIRAWQMQQRTRAKWRAPERSCQSPASRASLRGAVRDVQDSSS
jgi:hypothetical protein